MPKKKKITKRATKGPKARIDFDSAPESDEEDYVKPKQSAAKPKKERPTLELNQIAFSDLDGHTRGEFQYTKTAASGFRKGPVLQADCLVSHAFPINALKQIFARHPAKIDLLREDRDLSSGEIDKRITLISKDGITLGGYSRAFKECNITAHKAGGVRDTILADVIPCMVVPKSLEQRMNKLITEFARECDNGAILNDSELATQHPDVYMHAFNRCMTIYQNSLPPKEAEKIGRSLDTMNAVMRELSGSFTESFAKAGVPVSGAGMFGIDPRRPSRDKEGTVYRPIAQEEFDDFIDKHKHLLTVQSLSQDAEHHTPEDIDIDPEKKMEASLAKAVTDIGLELRRDGVTSSSEDESDAPRSPSSKKKKEKKRSI
ncbi:MAG: hypothetical protein K0T99_04895 [Alphaproteobacteria bacterium]|nr:hypothetical protein [Alphaproteobacteria bacterium]